MAIMENMTKILSEEKNSSPEEISVFGRILDTLAGDLKCLRLEAKISCKLTALEYFSYKRYYGVSGENAYKFYGRAPAGESGARRDPKLAALLDSIDYRALAGVVWEGKKGPEGGLPENLLKNYSARIRNFLTAIDALHDKLTYYDIVSEVLELGPREWSKKYIGERLEERSKINVHYMKFFLETYMPLDYVVEDLGRFQYF